VQYGYGAYRRNGNKARSDDDKQSFHRFPPQCAATDVLCGHVVWRLLRDISNFEDYHDNNILSNFAQFFVL
jgi:hypothetical protein